MNLFIGIKKVKAIVMTRGKYNEYRGWPIPHNENPNDEGYLVEYADNFKPNDPRHSGYISWSPKDVFENAYKPEPIREQFGYTTEFNKGEYVEFVNITNHENGSTILTVRNTYGSSSSMNIPPHVAIDLAIFLAARGIKLGA